MKDSDPAALVGGLIALADAAETRGEAEQALMFWAQAGAVGGPVKPSSSESRPYRLKAALTKRRFAVPSDWAGAATRPLSELISLVDDWVRLLDFQNLRRLEVSLETTGGCEAEFALTYLRMALCYQTQCVREARMFAMRLLEPRFADLRLEDCPRPGPVFKAQAIIFRTETLLFGHATFPVEAAVQRPVAYDDLMMRTLWSRSPAQALERAQRLAIFPKPPLAAEVLACVLQARLGHTEAAWSTFNAIALRRRVRGRGMHPELAMVGVLLSPTVETRLDWFRAYYGEFGLEAPTLGCHGFFDELDLALPSIDSKGPLVTICVTAFNAAKTVEAALNSLLLQTYRPLEIIVVDDRSSDETVRILRRMAATDDRIRVLTSDRNGGTYVAKNRALSVARGHYFTCHDADDWAHPRRIERHVALMEKYPQLVASRSDWVRMTDEGVPVLRGTLGVFSHANPASTFFRRETVMEGIGYYDQVRVDADLEHWLRLRAAFGVDRMARLRLPLALGRLHAASLTQFGQAAQNEEHFSAVRSEYRAAALAWRQRMMEAGDLRMPFPQSERPFPAPEGFEA